MEDPVLYTGMPCNGPSPDQPEIRIMSVLDKFVLDRQTAPVRAKKANKKGQRARKLEYKEW